MPEANTKPVRKQAEPKGLSSEYHKAHKQLMLWATILFIWEFVGVDLGKAKDAGGNLGPIVAALKSPQAVPWVLLVLVFYFLFKCSVEWAQSPADRRKVLFAKVDYIAALIVSGAAIVLYAVQAISRVQFADLIQSRSKAVFGLWYGLIAGGFIFAGSAWFLISRGKPRQSYYWRIVASGAGALFFIVIAFLRMSRFFLVIGILIGVGCAFLLVGRSAKLFTEKPPHRA